MKNQFLLSAALVAGLATMPLAQDVGSPIPAIELEDFTQTGAETWDDLQGRAVLIEFFAYW